MTKFLMIQLLRSGVEWNPGPQKKKRLKCPKCKKVVPTATGRCRICDEEHSAPLQITINNFSFDNSESTIENCNTEMHANDQLAQHMALYQTVGDSFILNIATSETLIEAGYQFGYFNQPVEIIVSHSDRNLLHYEIDELKNVAADGACLFHVLSLVLFGNESAACNIRRKICSEMLNIPFTPQQLFAGNRTCQNVADYIETSCMNYNYAYGGDVELATFSHITKLSVLVFVDSVRQWVQYSDPIPNVDQNHPQIFIFLSGSHFQLVTKLKLAMDYFRSSRPTNAEPIILETTTILNRCSSADSPVLCTNKEQTVKPQQSHFFPPNYGHTEIDYQYPPPTFQQVTQFKNFDVDCPTGNFKELNWEKAVLSDGCAKCGRSSTVFHPLQMMTLHSSTVASKRFGRKLPRDKMVMLCSCCFKFLADDSYDWDNGWPSAIYTFCFENKTVKGFNHARDFFSALPYQLQIAWLPFAKSVWTDFELKPIFRDLTNNIANFWNLIHSYAGKDYINAMNFYSYPSIRCFCGASTHLDTCGTVPFQHLLNYLNSSFVSFNANARKNLQSIRRDYLKICDDKLVFELRPSVMLNSSGLLLLTCEQHNSGTSLKMVHVAQHPLVGNLSHSYADRLAPIASSLRESTPIKVGEFSNTWTMSSSIAGSEGAGSIVLHSKRNFCVKSQALLPALESTFLNHRNDMIENVTQIAKENFLPAKLVSNLFHQYDTPKLMSVLESATIMPQETINRYKIYLETTDNSNPTVERYKRFCLMDRTLNDGTASLHLPSANLVKVDTNVALLAFFFLNCPQFVSCIITSQTPLPLALMAEIVSSMQKSKTFLNERIQSLHTELSRATDSTNSTFLRAAFRNIGVISMLSVNSFSEILTADPSKEIILVTSTVMGTGPPVTVVTSNDKHYLLIAIQTSQHSNGCFLFKNRDNEGYWEIDLKKRKIEQKTFPTSFRKLTFAIYCQVHFQSSPVFEIAADQNSIKCPEHNLPFCIELAKSMFMCSYDMMCSCKVTWRCLVSDCGLALCKKHHVEYENSHSSLFLRQRENIDFSGPSAALSGTLHLDTDAGSTHLPLENDGAFDDDIVSMHALLNDISSVLWRVDPVQPTKKLKRFFQRFLCLHPSSSSALVQLEALLFPSIFFYQMDDGSFPGAIPFFLYADDKACASFGFQSLLAHFRTRLSDPTLLTSSSTKYLQYAADALLNLNLKNKHTDSYIKRGIQSVELERALPQFENSCSKFSADTEIRCDELAAAMRTQEVSIFLTLTCNQKEHPGVAPLKKAIDQNFANASTEEKESANQAYITTFVRNWSRAVKYLIELLLHSSESLLGRIVKLWGRAEFQTLAGNLQHYHFLIWLLEGSADLVEIVQCSEKHIFYALLKIADSSMQLIDNEIHLNKLYDECIRIHTHNCEQSAGRCKKRKDLEGNKICRTPPYPPSHCNWVMDIETQYPNEALKTLQKLDLAEKIPGTTFGLRPTGILKCDKVMYAASAGEHILPTCGALFCITRSSTNILLPTRRFSSSYLSTYTTKKEEHSDGRILPATDGKSFRLRTEGIQNKFLATSKFLNQLAREKDRDVEKVDCRLVSLTESVFWVLGLPYVITTMQFVHVQNVPPELRYVKRKSSKINRNTNLQYQTFRDDLGILEPFQRLTAAQKTMAIDLQSSGQSDDAMSSFSIRPPELLCVNCIEKFCSWFVYDSKRMKVEEMRALFLQQQFKPWINGRGWQIKLRPSAIENFRDFLTSQNDDRYINSIEYNLRLLADLDKEDVQSVFVDCKLSTSKTNAEVVFASVNPRRTVDFLVAFVLRFGRFETELELFQTDSLLTSYVHGKLLPDASLYCETHLCYLLDKYVKNELVHLPGGSISFSTKLLAAKHAFSRLLHLESNDNVDAPVVLISEMRDKVNDVVDQFFHSRMAQVFTSLTRLAIPNLPVFPLTSESVVSLWKPVITFETQQKQESKLEQREVLKDLIDGINGIIAGKTLDVRSNHLVIGAPGTGKSHVCGVALAYAMSNGLVAYITSLAARRAVHVGGEHIHRLFGISVKKLPASVLANEALSKLENDLKRKYFLQKLQVLFVEEVSLIHAELWATMDIMLQCLKENESPFGGVLIIANGDCCQLPNVSGTDIFQSTSLIFTFHFHFLHHLVRMRDEKGQEVLKLLEERPVPQQSIDRICDLLSENCTFHNSWREVDSRMIMKVFGKKRAERQALADHKKMIESSGRISTVSEAKDEMCLDKSHIWRTADIEATKLLNKNSREPENLLLYDKAVLRLTRNLESSSQGDLFVLDFDTYSERSLSLFKAPNPSHITTECLDTELYRSWPKVTVGKTAGFTFATHNGSVRRVQYPFCNYVALTVHKLMGDTFASLATAISSTESMYSLWLTSQIYVIISRVRRLSSLHFVGTAAQTMDAIAKVLSTKHLHEESIYQFMNNLKNQDKSPAATVVPCTMYLRHHFEVPATENGFIFVLVSLADTSFSTFSIHETSGSLSEALREMNSTKQSALLDGQPWAMGLFIWRFTSISNRQGCFKKILEQVRLTNTTFPALKDSIHRILNNYFVHLSICITGKLINNDPIEC